MSLHTIGLWLFGFGAGGTVFSTIGYRIGRTEERRLQFARERTAEFRKRAREADGR